MENISEQTKNLINFLHINSKRLKRMVFFQSVQHCVEFSDNINVTFDEQQLNVYERLLSLSFHFIST